MATNTTPIIVVRISARSTCTACGKRVDLERELEEHALSTGNTTQRASYHATEMRELLTEEIGRRGWTSLICGGCRDGKTGLIGVVSETKGKPAAEQGGQDDCG